MNKKVVTAIVTLSLLTLTTITVSRQIKRTQIIQSKADTINIQAPYIRLSGKKNGYKPGDTVPVDIYVNTAGLGTLENRFVISYDKSILSLNDNGISNLEIYPVINIEKNLPGTTIFSVFVKNEAGYVPIALSEEKRVATLNFKATKSGNSDIAIVTDKANEASGIFSTTGTPENPAVNILKSNQGINITIN